MIITRSQFQPTPEEAVFIGMLENGILNALDPGDGDEFISIEDEVDVFPRFDVQRQRRSVDSKSITNLSSS